MEDFRLLIELYRIEIEDRLFYHTLLGELLIELYRIEITHRQQREEHHLTFNRTL